MAGYGGSMAQKTSIFRIVCLLMQKTTGNNQISKLNREFVCIIYVIAYKENEFLKYNLNECSEVILCIIRNMI